MSTIVDTAPTIDLDQFMQTNFYMSKLLLIFGTIFNFLIPELTSSMDALEALIYETGKTVAFS